MQRAKEGLLVMHYGTPSSLDEVLPYYTHIRRGRPPSDEQLQNLVCRYEAIGGPSPLTAISRRQAGMILNGLNERGHDATLYVGAKHANPFIGDAVRQMIDDGVEKATCLVLAPHYSSLSIGSYREYALAACKNAVDLRFLERWGTMPALIDALADRVRTQLEGWNADETLVIFTAHSLPARILAENDPYKEELLETAGLVASKLMLKHWALAFQSASGTGEPWLGPDILEVLADTGREGAFNRVVACTIGFVSDHLEVLYDLGIEAREKCDELNLGFRLAECINDDPTVMDGLAALAASILESD